MTKSHSLVAALLFSAFLTLPLQASAGMGDAGPEVLDGSVDYIVDAATVEELITRKLNLHTFDLVSVISKGLAEYTCHQLEVRTVVVEAKSSIGLPGTWRCTARIAGSVYFFGDLVCEPLGLAKKAYSITRGTGFTLGGCFPDDM